METLFLIDGLKMSTQIMNEISEAQTDFLDHKITRRLFIMKIENVLNKLDEKKKCKLLLHLTKQILEN